VQAFADTPAVECGVRLSIVIPALNESGRLPTTLERIAAYLAADGSWLPAEIIVVDDGSVDGTASAAGSLESTPRVRLRIATHRENRGKGAAVRTGFHLAAGDFVLLTDADLSAPIEELPLLARAAAVGGGVAVGSRAVDRRLIENPQPRHRDLMGRTFNLMVRALRLSRLHDTQCGFKLYPGRLANALAAVQRLNGFAFDVEHLVIAESWGHQVDEVAVRWQHVGASRVIALRHSSQMMRDLLRLWWWRLTRALPPRPEGGA
jgi:dolichyl-phosphate beta-glucosyltransferase